MSCWSAQLTFEVHDDLAEHPGAPKPPPNAVQAWGAADLFRAFELDLVEPRALTLLRAEDPSALASRSRRPSAVPTEPRPDLSVDLRQEIARAELEAADLYEASDAEDRNRMIETAARLVGHSVTDTCGRRWVARGVGVKDGWPTISGATFWERPEAVVDHGEAISADAAIQTVRDVLAEEDDVVAELEALLPRVHPLGADPDGVLLCPQCTSEEVGRSGEPGGSSWRCANCGSSFGTPLQQAG